ncbi:MAG: addiction module toxin RelE [Bacteroidetes bacterium]|nr:addiction module toxin RelE [Bacteroidota bacterium]
MKIEIVATTTFDREFKRLRKKYPSLPDDLLSLQEAILDNPDLGSDMGSGIRKIRMAIKSKNKGKSSGARIITQSVLLAFFERKIILVTMFDKDERESVSDFEIKQIIRNFGF